MSTILGVGIATLDIINCVADYPRENDEVRALAQTRARGGNVTNTLVVLSQLQHDCYWAGSLSSDSDSDLILADLAKNNIDCRYRVSHAQGSLPTSYITLNQRNGSRTIVHFRDLAEYSFDDFSAVQQENFQWIHFEGRNVNHTGRMLQSLRQSNYSGILSVEIEKPREAIEELFPLPDLLLFSRHFAQARGYRDGAAFLRQTRHDHHLHQNMVCAWGEAGAYGISADGQEITAPAYAPDRIVDTLGAGDVFNAGIIHALSSGQSLESALHSACALAGKKCGQTGFNGL